MLLSAAGLLDAALRGLEFQSFGFEQNDRMVAQVNPRLAGYRPDQLTPLNDRIREAVSRVPGVSGVALCIYSPFGNNLWGRRGLGGRTRSSGTPPAFRRFAQPGFRQFDALRVE